METEELRAALEALPVDERKRLAASVLSKTLDPTEFDRAAHAREIGKLGGRPKGAGLTQAHKDAIAAAQRKIGEERRAQKAEQPTQEKRRPGRPARTEPRPPPAAATRPVGRPPKPKPETTQPARRVGRPRKTETMQSTAGRRDGANQRVASGAGQFPQEGEG